MIGRWWIPCLLFSAACGPSGRSLPFYQTSDLTPEWLDRTTANAPTMHRVDNFHLVDQAGASVTASNLKGHITLVSFFFTECGSVCPMTRANLGAVLARFPNEQRLQILFHSVTPEVDSSAALAAYAASYHLVDPRWHLLTGAPSEIERVARDEYFVNLHDGSDFGTSRLAHTESVLLIDGEGRIRGVYSGSLRLEVDRMAADLDILLRRG